jgi:hypothetical protein
MPRRAKGARLYLRKGRKDRGSDDVYVIRDGTVEVSTGCGPEQLAGAERALEDYLAGKRQTPTGSLTDPADVLIADVLNVFVTERVPSLTDPVSNVGWVEQLLEFWGSMTCADIKRSTCNAYVARRMRQPRRAAKTSAAKAKRSPTRQLGVSWRCCRRHWDGGTRSAGSRENPR